MTYKPKTKLRIDRVFVSIDLPTDFSEREYRGQPAGPLAAYYRACRDLEDLLARVKRHLDDDQMPHGSRFESEVATTEICVHCDDTPEPDENGYPQCCAAAQAEADAAGATAAQAAEVE